MIDAICDELKKGKIYRVENIFRRILVRVLKYHNCKDDDGRTFTYNSIKKTLETECFEDYQGTVLRLAELHDFTRNTADQVIRTAINIMLGSNGKGVDAFSGLPAHFLEDSPQAHTQPESSNIIHDPIRGRKIQISTIHKVKGETHDATLYLETVNNRKSDLERVIPHYKGTKAGTTQLDKYSRKCVYVGFSRPKKLLCVAMNASTYEAAWKNFSGWEVYDCRCD